MSFRIETIAIGDELLTGRIADSNSAFVADELFRQGMRLERTQSVADEEAAIRKVVGEVADRADFVVCFGGLGPTSDDKTAAVVAGLLGVELVDHPSSMERLKEFARVRNRVLTPQLLKQVKYPAKTKALPNSVGLAPGFSCRIGKAQFSFLPGVPVEMKPMFRNHVLPEANAIFAGSGATRLLSRVWKCVGIPESELQRKMDAVEAALPSEAWLGYRTRFPENHLTLYWRSRDERPGTAFESHAKQIAELLGDLVYGSGDDELETRVFDELRKSRKSIAFAESCTGGLCVNRMTRVPGSSDHVWGGTVVYQTTAKDVLLGVKTEHPVSAQCTRELAQNLKARSGCDIAVGVTGFMGPSGGSQQDPIGTFYVCIVGDSKVTERRFFHPGVDREANQWGASTQVLNVLRLFLEGK